MRARIGRRPARRRERHARRRLLPQRGGQTAADHLVHQRLLQEPHLRLGRMDVDVHPFVRELQEQVHLGAARLDGGAAVGVVHRVQDGAVLDRAAVDEQVLRTADRPVGGQRGGQTGEPHPRRLLAHRDQPRPIPVDLEETVGERLHRRVVEERARAAPQPEADRGVREGDLRQGARDVAGLGPVRLEELAPGRHVVEEVADLDGGPLRQPGRGHPRLVPAVDRHLDAARRAAGARPQPQVRDRGDARQRLAPEAERGDGGKVPEGADLAGGVALDGQLRVVGRHPLAVVLDADQPLAAQLQRHRHPHGAGVEGVLDELLDRRGGPLDHLAGRDLVGQTGRQPVDPAHRSSAGSATGARARPARRPAARSARGTATR